MFSFDNLLEEKRRPLVMGILNVTPDSFSDGAQAFSRETVIAKVKSLCNQGADIIDVGACSTAPVNDLASTEEELRRLELFLPLVLRESTVPVSIDTFRPEIARYAVQLGVSIINDESGAFNEEMAVVVKQYGCGWIFMHTGDKSSSQVAEYKNGVVQDVLSFFGEMKRRATEMNIALCQLSFDCGIGFGKTRDDDLTLLASCDVLSGYSPLLIGASRKRIIGALTGIDVPSERVEGSVAVAKLVAQDGAKILRVHDVAQTVEAISNINKGSIYNGKDNYQRS